MDLRFIGKTSLVLFSVLASTTVLANAKAEDKQVPCPSISMVQNAVSKIDYAEKFNGYYVVSSHEAAFTASDLMWYVGVNKISASNIDEAITKGKTVIGNISSMGNALAKPFGDFTLCTYGPGEVIALGGEVFTTDVTRMLTR